MCQKYVSMKIYACGARGEKETFKFDACSEKDKPGHKVTQVEMGSNKVKDRCGKYTCAVCGAENCEFLKPS